ncbi:DUF3500 domain-containing protein [Nonomuraea africana]|uniref:DUF3500 domain-containing protein n=1 Tax=Nonomuraea africana TaxID=46171 RepID=A0ABR9K949_9ACTN|nr:DUF3500 domain-containing protein [Nonomuraea africana]MBE1558532.1 hypothetical protein [Nonomuraea africana]
MRMAEIAAQFLGSLTEPQRQAAAYSFDDALRLRWTYVPAPRPGVSLLGLGREARKAAHRLLATALSRHAFAQVVTIMALEEVLDLDEGGRRGRHSDDYHLAIFGTPGDAEWSWRFEGHHVSVTATVSGGRVEVAPLFLGAHPAGIWYGGAPVVRPLPLEEELARALLDELSPALRGQAIVADDAPADILTGTSVVTSTLEPLGLRGAVMGSGERELLAGLTAVYLDRLAPHLRGSHDAAQLSFAWAGSVTRGAGHYYRIQGPGLLIEYDNTQDAVDHAHSVIRRPGADFGAAILPAHLAGEREGT